MATTFTPRPADELFTLDLKDRARLAAAHINMLPALTPQDCAGAIHRNRLSDENLRPLFEATMKRVDRRA